MLHSVSPFTSAASGYKDLLQFPFREDGGPEKPPTQKKDPKHRETDAEGEAEAAESSYTGCGTKSI